MEVGEKGHLNADSDLGDWPEGLRLLLLLDQDRRSRAL
ncbi:hypothetical protein [Paraburkholderia sprentiae]